MQVFRGMRRTLVNLLFGMLLLAAPGAAQAVISTTVATTFPQAFIRVDGVEYQGTQTFLWVEGSTHILEVNPLVQSNQTMLGLPDGVRYNFNSWSENTGRFALTGARIVVQTTPEITTYTANFLAEIYLDLQMPPCVALPQVDPASRPVQIPYPPGDSPCLPRGLVLLNGSPYTASIQTWVAPESVLNLQAQATNGFVFNGWRTTFGNGRSFLTELAPPPIRLADFGRVTVVPSFETAHRVRFRTRFRGACAPEPDDACPDAGIRFFLDGAQAQTPTANTLDASNQWLIRDWLPGSRHILAAVTPQRDWKGKTWVFDGWSVADSKDTQIQVTAGPASAQFAIASEITAWYGEGFTFFLNTQPNGLQMMVNGRTWPSYSFYATVGTKFEIEAPEEQTGPNGRRYRFREWSNGGARKQTVEFTQEMANSGRSTVAVYDLLGRATIRTNPTGLPITVDGRACAQPCVLDRPVGATANVAVQERVTSEADTRAEFVTWSDAETAARSITLTDEPRTYTAEFRAAYRINASVSEPEAGTISFSPASTDGFYARGTEVRVTVTPNPGWKLRRWSGNASGTGLTEVVFAEGPATLTALMERENKPAERGVRNAAGTGEESGVGPGSIVSFFGGPLATETREGQRRPVLSQSLSGTTVRLGERLLGLLFVSPDQINAVLPADLPEGEHTAVISSPGVDEATIRVDVVRNSPGIFSQRIADRDFAIALRPDGSLVTTANPARRGERIRILGTGFGPFRNQIVEGFPIPAAPRNPLVDSVDVLLGDAVLAPAEVYATPGEFGMVTMELQIDERFPASATPEIQVRINGRRSNRVLLPLQ